MESQLEPSRAEQDTMINMGHKTPDNDAEIIPTSQATKLNSLPFILTMVALALSVFCLALDNVIIVTAIPKITDDFHSIKHIGW